MLPKIQSLLQPLKNLPHKATILRVALAGIVLGLGSFAVYKGVQQMKPARAAPKRTETVVNKLRQEQGEANPDLDPTGDGDSQVRVVSGHSEVGGDDGGSLYVSDDDNPAASYTGSNLYPDANQTYGDAGSDQGGDIAADQGGTEVADDEGTQDSSVAGSARRIRTRPPTAPSHSVGDEAAAEVIAAGDQPEAMAATEEGAGPYTGQAYGANGAYGDESTEQQPAADGSGGGYANIADGEIQDDSQQPAPLSQPSAIGVVGRRGPEYQASPAATGGGSTLRPIGSRAPGSSRTAAGPAAAGLSQSAIGGGTPGERELEGSQVPSLAIEKTAPAEIQVGKAATFEIRVRNTSSVPAHDVLVTDQVPRGTRLESTSPEAELAPDGTLVWQLGAMQPGDEVLISMHVLPEQEGEIGSVAQVVFTGKATARSVCTRPLLSIEHAAPKQVLIGETVRLSITVHNPGTGAATGVIVEEDVPEGLTHVAGSELEYEIGTLRPGETRELELQLTADRAGLIENMVTVRGEGNLIAQHSVPIEVIAPQLEVAVNGPKIRYLERQATYTLSIENPGTAAARSVQLVAFLPKGMKFQSTDAEGQYDAAQHAVFWSLEELPASKSGSVNLVAVPIEPGEQRLRVEGKADLGLTAASEQIVQVEARSELAFNIVDVNDPIEVGTDTAYEIRVSNNGTRPATAVELAAGFPAQIQPVSADGHSRGEVSGQQVVFEPVGRINPGEEITFRIVARGAAEGDHVIAVQIRSAEFPTPVTREESTRVYVDR